MFAPMLDLPVAPAVAESTPTPFAPFTGMPAAFTVEQSILLAQLVILRRIDAFRLGGIK